MMLLFTYYVIKLFEIISSAITSTVRKAGEGHCVLSYLSVITYLFTDSLIM